MVTVLVNALLALGVIVCLLLALFIVVCTVAGLRDAWRKHR